MLYLFVTNNTIRTSINSLNGSFVGLLCNTRYNIHSINQEVYLVNEELIFIKNSNISKKHFPHFSTIVVWSREHLRKITNSLPKFQYNIVVLRELLRDLDSTFVNDFKYNIVKYDISTEADRRKNCSYFYNDTLHDCIQYDTRTNLQRKIQNDVKTSFFHLMDNTDEFTIENQNYLHDLKFLFFVIRFHMIASLSNNGITTLAKRKESTMWHLLECDDMRDSGECHFDAEIIYKNGNDSIDYDPVAKIFDGICVCNKCKKELSKYCYNNDFVDSNELMVSKFCSKYNFQYQRRKNGDFIINTNISKWIIMMKDNSNLVRQLFHESKYYSGSSSMKGKNRKMGKLGYHKQKMDSESLSENLNYIKCHERSKEKEKFRVARQLRKYERNYK